MIPENKESGRRGGGGDKKVMLSRRRQRNREENKGFLMERRKLSVKKEHRAEKYVLAPMEPRNLEQFSCDVVIPASIKSEQRWLRRGGYIHIPYIHVNGLIFWQEVAWTHRRMCGVAVMKAL